MAKSDTERTQEYTERRRAAGQDRLTIHAWVHKDDKEVAREAAKDALKPFIANNPSSTEE